MNNYISGNMVAAGQFFIPRPKWEAAPGSIQPNTWFSLEVIAQGERIVVKVNGKSTTDYRDPERRFTTGHLALFAGGPDLVVHYRKIEIKELLPN